jgi:hypothetical protein
MRKDQKSTLTELDPSLWDAVSGGWFGNPGNYKPVGRAGETPSGNFNFIYGGSYIYSPDPNGRAGNSGQ